MYWFSLFDAEAKTVRNNLKLMNIMVKVLSENWKLNAVHSKSLIMKKKFQPKKHKNQCFPHQDALKLLLRNIAQY